MTSIYTVPSSRTTKFFEKIFSPKYLIGPFMNPKDQNNRGFKCNLNSEINFLYIRKEINLL